MSDASEVKKNAATAGRFASGVGQNVSKTGAQNGGFVVGPNGSATKVADVSARTTKAAKAVAATNALENSSRATGGSVPQFRSERIGEWAARQEGYFAEQNRRAEERRQQAEQKRRQALPVIFTVGGVITAGLIIWGIVAVIIAMTKEPAAMPSEGDFALGSEAGQEALDRAEMIWQEAMQGANGGPTGNGAGGNGGATGGNSGTSAEGIAAVTEYFDERVEQAQDANEKTELMLIEMALFAEKSQPESVIKAAERVKPAEMPGPETSGPGVNGSGATGADITLAEMTEAQKGRYYGMLMNAYYSRGDAAKADEYRKLLEQNSNNSGVTVEG